MGVLVIIRAVKERKAHGSMALRNSPTKSETVWRSGWEGVMANRTPMLVLWASAFALVAAYYNVPTATRLLQPIFNFQINGGWMAAVVNRVVFCGFLPGVFLLAGPSIRPRRVAATIIANCVWMGVAAGARIARNSSDKLR